MARLISISTNADASPDPISVQAGATLLGISWAYQGNFTTGDITDNVDGSWGAPLLAGVNPINDDRLGVFARKNSTGGTVTATVAPATATFPRFHFYVIDTVADPAIQVSSLVNDFGGDAESDPTGLVPIVPTYASGLAIQAMTHNVGNPTINAQTSETGDGTSLNIGLGDGGWCFGRRDTNYDLVQPGMSQFRHITNRGDVRSKLLLGASVNWATTMIVVSDPGDPDLHWTDLPDGTFNEQRTATLQYSDADGHTPTDGAQVFVSLKLWFYTVSGGMVTDSEGNTFTIDGANGFNPSSSPQDSSVVILSTRISGAPSAPYEIYLDTGVTPTGAGTPGCWGTWDSCWVPDPAPGDNVDVVVTDNTGTTGSFGPGTMTPSTDRSFFLVSAQTTGHKDRPHLPPAGFIPIHIQEEHSKHAAGETYGRRQIDDGTAWTPLITVVDGIDGSPSDNQASRSIGIIYKLAGGSGGGGQVGRIFRSPIFGGRSFRQGRAA